MVWSRLAPSPPPPHRWASVYNVPATVSEVIQFASIPLFQFAIFYNMDLEIDPRRGHGHRRFGMVQWRHLVGPPNVSYSAIRLRRSGVINLTGQPIRFAAQVDSGTGTSTYKFPSQRRSPATIESPCRSAPTMIPLPSKRLSTCRRTTYPLNTAAAFTTNGQFYFANSADLYLTNFPTGTNWGSLAPQGTNMILFYQDRPTSSFRPRSRMIFI